MDEVVVLASFKVKKGREDEAAAAFERVAAATHQEDGCQKYAWVQALNDLTVCAGVEKWRSI